MDSGIQPDTGAAWRTVADNFTGVGSKIIQRVLGIDPALDRMPSDRDLFLSER